MKRLKPKEIGVDSDYDAVISGRSESDQRRLRRAKPAVLCRQREYINKKQQLESLDPSPYAAPTVARESLQSCYVRNKSEVASLIQSILDLQDKSSLLYCPMCSINEPDTIDHYAPRDLYPEFSVFAPNLVPCCSKCNRRKSNLNVSPVRNVLSAYYDKVIGYQFLYCKINADRNLYIPNYYLRRCRGISVAEIELVQRHFARFGLLRSYEEKAAARLVVEMESVNELVRTIGPDQTAEHVLRRSKRMADIHGKNHWESVLLKEISRMISPPPKRIPVV